MNLVLVGETLGLELDNLTKTFPGFSLGPLNLHMENEVLVMIGPSGSGKTTILNLIAGLITPDGGSIILDGKDLAKVPIESRKIGYAFQKPNLFPHLNVYDNIIFGVPKKQRDLKRSHVKRLLDELEISHLSTRQVQDLSGGEMQKVSLARMLAIEPKILLMDEPFTYLDLPIKKKLRLDLRKILRKQGVPTIYVTHFEDDVYALADSVITLHNGKVEHRGNLDTLLASDISPFISQTFAESNYIEGKIIRSENGITIMKNDSHLFEAIGEFKIGSKIGILVRPEDILLSKESVKTSARNVVKCKAVKITHMLGMTNVQLQIGSLCLKSRITREAIIDLDIKEGDDVFAIFKATSPQIIREES